MSTIDEATGSAGGAPAARPASSLGVRLVRLVLGDGDQGAARQRAATAFLVRVASAGLLYLSQIILARWMGGFEYGIYVFVWTWVLVLGGLSNLGFSTLMIRLVPEHRERAEWARLRGLLVWGRVMPLAAASLIAGVAFTALHLGGELLSRPYVLPATIALACVPMIALSDIQDGIGRGRGWMSVALLPPYVLRPLLVLLAMIVAHEIDLPMSAVTAAGAAVAGTWLAAVVQTLLLSAKLRQEVPPGPRERPIGLWLGTSLPLLAITFSEVMLQNTDVLVVSQNLGPMETGIYFAAAKTMSLVMFVHYAVGSAMAGRFAALNARGDREGLAAAVRDAVNWTFWPSLAAALAILVLGRPLLWLFGPQFIDGHAVMMVLVLGFLGRAAMGPSEMMLNMLGQQRATATAAVVVAIVNIGLNLVLVRHFGLLGCASATAASLLLGACLNTAIARWKLGLRIGIWSNVGRRGASRAASERAAA